MRIFIAVLLAIFTAGYMLPFSVALVRDTQAKLGIFLVNLFLGWSLIGWVVALVWAIAERQKAMAAA